MAQNLGLLCGNNELLSGIATSCFGLLGFPGSKPKTIFVVGSASKAHKALYIICKESTKQTGGVELTRWGSCAPEGRGQPASAKRAASLLAVSRNFWGSFVWASS